MPDLPDYQRILILTEGHLGVFTSKTAASLLRYLPNRVVALIDSTTAGTDLRQAIPWAPASPILSNVAAAAALKPEALFIGVAPVGGALAGEMRAHIRDALRAGLDIVSGLHTRLCDDAEFAGLANAHGARLFDLRKPPKQSPIASRRAVHTRCRRVLTVGTDGNVGKMVAALELTGAARDRGLDTRFIATGQTGIMIEGCGVAVDAVVSDFVAGAIEELIVAAGDCDLCIVEGQGSIGHPGFSGVTLSLLHGVCPDAMILVHVVGRTHYRSDPSCPIPELRVLRAAYEDVAGLLHPARVVGVALNTFGADEQAADREAQLIEQELGVPVADVLRQGSEALLTAALSE